MSSGQAHQNSLFAALRGSNLLVLTSLAAVDGTIFLLAAGGALSTASGAIVAGLTVIGGAGAWLTARDEYGRRELSRRDWAEMATVAALAVAATVAAAAAGAWLAGAVQLTVLPHAAGLVILLVAAEIYGVELPRLRGLPLTVVTLIAAILLEVSLAWIP